jgi:nuclear pore complex protein Nup205
LAALGKSIETAVQLWNLLEASQVIVTIPTTSNFANRGIASELEEIESRNETYPLTKSMLHLLHTLSSIVVPKNLGAGPRKPGLDPYLTFIIDTVFLKFYNRNYKDVAEKWEIAEKCLKILEMFIQNYAVNPSDFPVSGVVKDENPDPGFHIALQMHTKSQFLCLILHLIDESCTLLDSYTPFPGKKHLENSILYCLNIIAKCLTDQDAFFDAHFTSSSSILLSGLNKLLLGVNARSGMADHMLNITKFVTYNSWLPKHSLQAIRILTLVMRQPNVNSQLLGIFTHNEKIKQEIRQGFVECLENEFVLDVDDQDNVELLIKESVVNLLQECLPQSSPNLAHYLLGFDINKDIRLTRLQQPGVMGFPSTCAKSLVTVLDNALEISKQGRSVSTGHEKFIEKAYSFLYSLCYNSKTSEVFLRFLRSCSDFLCRHINGLPFHNSKSSHVLNQMTGLLKCVAIELKLTADNNQISQFSNLCKILLGVSQNASPENIQLELGHYHSMMGSSIVDQTAGGTTGKKSTDACKLLICELLETLSLDTEPIDKPKFDYFDSSQMQSLFQNCELASSGNAGPKTVDLKKLHDILKDELNSVQTTIVAGQRQYIMQEIETIMLYALQINNQRNMCSAKIKYLESWGQVTEIIFSVQPTLFFATDIKQNLILEILQSLLKQVVPAQIMQELANLASSTVLLLLMNLRTCYMPKTLEMNENDTQNSQILGNVTFSPPDQTKSECLQKL